MLNGLPERENLAGACAAFFALSDESLGEILSGA